MVDDVDFSYNKLPSIVASAFISALDKIFTFVLLILLITATAFVSIISFLFGD